MKKTGMKKLIAILLVAAVACLPALAFAEETESTSGNADLRGTWTGTYSGSDGFNTVDRRITLDIFSCDSENGDFEGIAKINNAGDGKYYFTGSIDYDTREISFCGDEWISNPNNFGFTSFEGVVNDSFDSMSGWVESDRDRDFYLVKSSEDYTSMALTPDSIPLDWKGEYDGHRNYTIVRRNYEFHIQSIDEDGNITGTAIISPSEKAAASLGANGSYLFSGTIDYRYGGIHMQGYEWTDYPDNGSYDSWDFVKLSGVIDSDAGTIEGESEDGIWSMTSMDYISYDTDSGFTLDQDNNSFANSDDESQSNAGFVGVTDYHLDSDYFDTLTKNLSYGETNRIKKTMRNEWNGSGYGIATTMALLYEGCLSMDELSSESADSYYEMDYPYLNDKLLNNIAFYQLSQSLINGSAESVAVSRAYNYNFLSGLTDRDSNYDSMSVCLQELVNDASDGHVELLVLTSKEESDALLVTGCKYEEDSETYRLEIYDANSVTSDADAEEPLIMEIQKDFSTFNFTDAKGKTITEDNYVSIYFLDSESMEALVSGSSDENSDTSYTYIEFPLNSSFKLTTADGDDLTYDEKKISGNIYVYDIATIAADDCTRIVLATDNTDSYELTDLDASVDIEIYNEDDYMALSGSWLDSLILSFGEGISIKGTDFDFEAYITTDNEVEDDKELVFISAFANEEVTINCEDGMVSVETADQIRNAQISNYIGSDSETETIDEPVSEIEFSETGLNYKISDEQGEETEDGDASDEETILQRLDVMQSELDELREENEMLRDALEEESE